MRLLQIHGSDKLSLVELLPDNLPPYAILSHTWGPPNEEVTYQDFLDGKGKEKIGYRKLIRCGQQAAQDGFQYFWVDTCCIDKTSSAELSEAINSMYSWYQLADVCYAYLADIGPKDSFTTSKWFTRGWTLQELLAPEEMIFFDEKWFLLGTRAGLREQIFQRTQIPVNVLSQAEPLEHFSAAQRMSWAAERKTTRIEDIAYCLLGIFNINMPLIYGEGENAFIRLQEEILKISDDHSIFAWRSTDDRGGCLATSPASFRKSGNIVQCVTLDRSYDPVILSGKGVHLNVRFMGIGHDKLGCAKLDCHEQGSGDERISIYVRDMNLTMKQLKRVKSNEFAQTNFEDFISSRGNESIVRMLLNHTGIDINPRDILGRTPTWWAAIDGHRAVVRLLLETSKVKVNLPNDNGSTPLFVAADAGHLEIVELLLTMHGIDANAKDKNGLTPLFVAVRAGHVEIVRLLSKIHGIDANAENKNGSTLLSVAVQSGNQAIVGLLLRVNGIDVNRRDKNWSTLLIWATKTVLDSAVVEDHSGKLDDMIAIIRLLLKMGKANSNIRDGDGRTSFSYLAAAKDERIEPICEFLVREIILNENSSLDQDGNSPLLAAILASELPVIKLLLKAGGVNVNFKNKDGLSPLLAAVFVRRDAVVVKLLLRKAEIEVNIRDNHGRTPISRLANYTYNTGYDMAKLLLKAPSIQLDSKDRHGRTPLSWAAASGNIEMVKSLLGASNVNVNSQDNNGRTPLSWAASSNSYDIVQVLLRMPDTDANLKDHDGRTPLSWAIRSAGQGTIEALKRQTDSRRFMAQ
ncbi:hypothetical protein GGP41_004773 [Bipolaris sorokiniana]|uniref:Heterokaryon incompatibility domain-containing protein n=2 Tax=Cochliobolus sativus TaxID=45130 RepID=A0A8H5ZCD7_COCSA|nr:hypothetical protein GGP41_004773 [Bipolaris sorokiniana]